MITCKVQFDLLIDGEGELSKESVVSMLKERVNSTTIDIENVVVSGVEEVGLHSEAITFPCNIGDTMYCITRNRVIPLVVTGLTINRFGILIDFVNEEEYFTPTLPKSYIGEILFYSEEEALKHL